MSPEDELLARKEKLNDTLIGIAGRTVAFVVALVVVALLIGSINGLPVVYTGLSFLFLPLVVGILVLYVSSVLSLVMGGRMARPISAALNLLAGFVFLAFLAASSNLPAGLNLLALPLLAVGAGAALVALGKAYSDSAKTVTRALLIAAVGYLAMVIPAAFWLPDSQIVGPMLFIGFILASLTSLLGLLGGHSNEYLAAAGKMFGTWGWPAFICLLCLVLLTYDHYVKPVLVSAIAGGVVILEWSVLIAAFAYIGLIIVRTVKWNSQGRAHGDLHTLVQKISYDRKSLEAATTAVEGFVENGKKEGLIVYLSVVLIENKVSPGSIERIISGIVGYEDEREPTLALKWAVGNTAGKNRKRRLSVLYEAILAASHAAGYDSAAERLSQPGEKPMEEPQLVLTR